MGLFSALMDMVAANKASWLELQDLVTDKPYGKLIMSKKRLLAVAKSCATRDIKIMQDCSRILQSTNKPETFFSRLDLFNVQLNRLMIFQKHIRFSGVNPSRIYDTFQKEYQELLHNFLVRYFSDVFDHAEKLKTDKSKLARYQKFYDSLQPYYVIMNEDNIDYIETKYKAYTRYLKK